MTSEELEVNDALEASGADVWGDRPRRVRLADRRRGTLAHCRSGHSQVPRGDRGPVQRGVREPDEPLETAEELTRFARGYLGEKILDEVGRHGRARTSSRPTPGRSRWSRARATPGNACSRRTPTSRSQASRRSCRASRTSSRSWSSSVGRGPDRTSPRISRFSRRPATHRPSARLSLNPATTASSTSCSSTTVGWRCARTTSSGRRCTASGVRRARTRVKLPARRRARVRRRDVLRRHRHRLGGPASTDRTAPPSSTTSVRGVVGV